MQKICPFQKSWILPHTPHPSTQSGAVTVGSFVTRQPGGSLEQQSRGVLLGDLPRRVWPVHLSSCPRMSIPFTLPDDDRQFH